MPLQKQSLNINFSQGLETKTDPYQIPFGKFLNLRNCVFRKQGRLTKRYGNKLLTQLPYITNEGSQSFLTPTSFVTTFSGNLTSIGPSLLAFSIPSEEWIDKGDLKPVTLSTLPLIRSNNTQSQADSVVSPNGLVLTAYTDQVSNGTSNSPVYKYVIADVATGQNIIYPTELAGTAGAVSGSPRVFILGNYFVIVFTVTITAVNHLQYIAINFYSTSDTIGPTDITAQYTPASTVAWDGVVSNNNLYLAWNGNDGGGAIRVTYIDSTFIQHATVVFAGESCEMMGVCVSLLGSSQQIYVVYYKAAGTTSSCLVVNANLATLLAPTVLTTIYAVNNVTCCAAFGGSITYFLEAANTYSYNSVQTNRIVAGGISTFSSSGFVIIARSVGLASKAFNVVDQTAQAGFTTYFLAVYDATNGSSYKTLQPTYFLMQYNGQIVARLAMANAGGYVTTGLPSVTTDERLAYMAYFYKDQIRPINSSQGGSNSVDGIYSQLGINLVKFDIGNVDQFSAEIASDLHITGGFLWMYDGFIPVEYGFHVYPENLHAANATTGGLQIPQQYYYIAVYEWTDNQGNIFRSAPSLPLSFVVPAGTNTNLVTVDVPTLRLTYKSTNPPKITVYRWSTAQQTYYQMTSIITPILNAPGSDSIAILDGKSDAQILGNEILYTTGGVIENLPAPASQSMTLFKSRLFMIDSEDLNLLWYSKKVIEATPVEMSDLLTLFVPPTTSAQQSTGPCRCLGPMDDKLIIFKDNAIYYLTGDGPDNTGAQNDYGEPVFVTSTVGCNNQRSIVGTPIGIMFQAGDSGIWLLGRDLSTKYIGAAVEEFNSYKVLSANNIPDTNQIRFALSNGLTLVYNYFFDQWAIFDNVPATSSTIYQSLYTFIDQFGRVYQEAPGTYADGSRPVLMSFATGWFNLAGLQGFERIYQMYLLGTYLSPHKLTVQIGYDYNSSPQQSIQIVPDNFSGNYGDDPLYGNGQYYGGQAQLEQWQIYFQQQKCQSFQITVNEYFDSTLASQPGAGLTLSGLNLVVGAKSQTPKLKASRSVG